MKEASWFVKCKRFVIVKQVKTYPTKGLCGIEERSKSSEPLKKILTLAYHCLFHFLCSLITFLTCSNSTQYTFVFLVLIQLFTLVFDLILESIECLKPNQLPWCFMFSLLLARFE